MPNIVLKQKTAVICLLMRAKNPIIVNAHKLTSASNGNVKYDSKVLDYDSLTYEDNRYLTFDLTSTFKGWYSDTNTKGFVMEALDTVGSKKVVFKSYTKNIYNTCLNAHL